MTSVSQRPNCISFQIPGDQYPIAIGRSSSAYPSAAEIYLNEKSPDLLYAIGNVGLLSRPKVALFCGSRCSGSEMLKTSYLAERFRAQGRTVIGGFHSPMEKECLEILLRSPHPVIIVPARGLGGIRVRREWKRPLAEERLLILSPFHLEMKRATVRDGSYRNLFVAAVAEEVCVAHADPQSKVAALAVRAKRWGKPVRYAKSYLST